MELHETWILYLRKSRQDDPNETVEEVLVKHETQLQEYAARELGGAIPEENIYREIGSGESIAERVEIKKVLARLEDPAIRGVLVMEPSRLSRGDLSDCAKIIDAFRFSHSLIATPYMTYNLEKKMERKFFQDELLRGNDYLEYTKEILWRGRVAACKRGCYLGNYPPYGYKKIKIEKDHTLEVIEEEAEVVRMVYDLYMKEGLTPLRIADRLNEIGVKPARGKKWVKDSVRVMLRNPHYAGFVAFNQKKTTPVMENGTVVKKRLAQAEEDVIIAEGKQPAIIERGLWEQAQELVARNPKVDYKRHALKNPLSGILICRKCGKVMQQHPYKHADDRIECRTRPRCYKSAKLHEVMAALRMALQEAELPALEAKVKNGDGDAVKIQQRLLAKLEKQMADYRAQEERQYELLETNPNYPPEVFERRNAALRAKMEECQAAIYKAKSALPESVDYAERVITLKAAIDILGSKTATPSEQNRVLKSIIKEVLYESEPSDPKNLKRGPVRFTLEVFLRL